MTCGDKYGNGSLIDHDAASAAVAAVLLDCEGEPSAPVADEHEPTFAQLLAEC